MIKKITFLCLILMFLNSCGYKPIYSKKSQGFEISTTETYGDKSGSLLLVSWGGTSGSVRSAVDKARANKLSVSHIHLKYINPFPKNLGEVLLKFENILIPELNSGQLSVILRNKFLVDSIGLNKVEGKPFSTGEIYNKILNILGKK